MLIMHKDEYALSYIVSFGLYILRLTPFDFFEVKWKTSHIFKSFFGCKDIGQHMEMHGDKLKWKREEDDFFIVLRARSTLNPKSQRV